MKRIVVFRALQLGDLLCTVPALRALRIANPSTKITLVGLPWAAEFVARYQHYLDEFIPFPGHPAFPERQPALDDYPAFIDLMQKSQFDLALQLHGSGEVANPVVALFGAARMAGFAHPHAFCGRSSGFIPWPDDLPEIDRYLQLTTHLGWQPQGTTIDLPLASDECERGKLLLEDEGVRAERLVCIHPGARLPSRRWPAERFGEVARQLLASGYEVVVTGSDSEQAIVDRVIRLAPGSRSLCGRTEFGVLAAIIASARLLISNDTGVSHVAAAVRTPSVIVASGSDVKRWRPLNHDLHTVHFADLECRPCTHHECPIGHPCALEVDVSTVLASAKAALQRYPVYPLAVGVPGSLT